MITPTPASTAFAPSPVSYSTGSDELDRNTFLRLLTTQIQMQDPLEPVSGQEFVAQLAQFSMVEQLESTNLQLSILQRAEAITQSLALIGRQIATRDDSVSGVVEAVIFADGQPKRVVGGEQIDPGDVIRVW